jgi:hypothetical protein
MIKLIFFFACSSHLKELMPTVHLHIGEEIITPSRTVRNLGIVFDDVMSMSEQVKSLSCNVNYHLRNIARIRRFMDLDTCNNVVRSLVLSRLDYGNALFLGTNISEINRLQRLQNWAAKLIFCALKHDHATPYLSKLHWLPIRERIHFKILLYVYKCINEQAPEYLSSCFSLYTQTRTGLRSSLDTTRLAEPKSSYKFLMSAADKSFSFTAPALWNRLPTTIRTSNSVHSFKKALKTYLFAQYFTN